MLYKPINNETNLHSWVVQTINPVSQTFLQKHLQTTHKFAREKALKEENEELCENCSGLVKTDAFAEHANKCKQNLFSPQDVNAKVLNSLLLTVYHYRYTDNALSCTDFPGNIFYQRSLLCQDCCGHSATLCLLTFDNLITMLIYVLFRFVVPAHVILPTIVFLLH